LRKDLRELRDNNQFPTYWFAADGVYVSVNLRAPELKP
jgi:hypothetical protein